MTPEEAIQTVQEKFPFDGYMDYRKGVYLETAKTILRYLQPGDRILDFGSGPCDRTAVIQTLGFQCSACDDLQDYWHTIEGNRHKIVAFAREFGIDFKLTSGECLPFKRSSFDMLMMHDVLEHLHDSPRHLLNNLLMLVKAGGYFFTTVPNAVSVQRRTYAVLGKTYLPRFEHYYWYPGPWRGHIREYTKDDLVKLSEFLDLDVIELRGHHSRLRKLKKLPRIVRLVYLGMTGVFEEWRDCWLLVAKKRPGWVPKNALSKDELYEILGASASYQY